MGLTVDRINGNDRYELSGNVSTWFGTGEKKVLVVNGEEHLMTYGIASYAARTGTPIILTRQGTLTDYTKAMAGRFKASIMVGI
ncbi:cell wall-binding repeat-containing protein, partial [Klebsiella pneumoniae]|uniref:cell wall-binding repeat-containing protein n=1 Tax=Klebsiella pneumoniae TaxID=573 RepID=UPI003B981873